METGAIEAARRYHRRREKQQWAEREALRRERLEAVRAAVRRSAPGLPAVAAVHLFGSILRPGSFTASSDIDVAVDCDDPETESRLWRELEETLEWNVDLRPRQGAVARAVERGGECVYEREAAGPRAGHPE